MYGIIYAVGRYFTKRTGSHIHHSRHFRHNINNQLYLAILLALRDSPQSSFCSATKHVLDGFRRVVELVRSTK